MGQFVAMPTPFKHISVENSDIQNIYPYILNVPKPFIFVSI